MARPLNNIKGTGEFYIRPAEIEASIDEALTQDLEAILQRANIRSPKKPGYMPLECLLHLAREARLTGDKQTENKLLRPLLMRCELILKKSIPDGSVRDAESVRQDILDKFSELFALVGSNYDATRLDFFECRFQAAFASLRYQRVRQEARRDKVFVEFDVEQDEEGKPLDDENALAKLSAAAQSPARQEGLTYLGQVFEHIKTFPPEIREAVMLVAVQGHKIESEDPDEVTAATLSGVSGRTIRKRLQKAATLLKTFHQE